MNAGSYPAGDAATPGSDRPRRSSPGQKDPICAAERMRVGAVSAALNGGSGAADTSIQSHSVARLADFRQFLMTASGQIPMTASSGARAPGMPGDFSGRGFADGVGAGD
jgi:hypothetical protein